MGALAQESHLTLAEGEGSNVSSSYNDWELAAWDSAGGDIKKIYAYDTNSFTPEKIVSFELNKNSRIIVKKYFPNAQAYLTSEEDKGNILNASEIQRLTSIPINKEPEKNLPGGIFELSLPPTTEFRADTIPFLLFGGETQPTQIRVTAAPAERKIINLQLRKQRYPLPFVLTLADFEMEQHPGTEIARSYKSHVTIEHDGIKREVLISMNHPLRYKNYTLYQASYMIDPSGREFSTLAVVKNPARLLPYISSLVTFLGLVTHFLILKIVNRNHVSA